VKCLAHPRKICSSNDLPYSQIRDVHGSGVLTLQSTMADEGSINSSSATVATLDTSNEAIASAGRKRGSCFNEVENLMIARAFINA
jgi:hypothetical protein